MNIFKVKLFLLVPLLLLIMGCASTSNNMDSPVADSPDALNKYQKLYYDYRALVTKAIKSNNETNLGQITDEYISKTGNNIFLITVSQLDSSGKWNVLLHKAASLRLLLPAVNYAYSDKVYIYRGKGYVMCESNKTRNHSYKDNIHIKMGIKR